MCVCRTSKQGNVVCRVAKTLIPLQAKNSHENLPSGFMFFFFFHLEYLSFLSVVTSTTVSVFRALIVQQYSRLF